MNKKRSSHLNGSGNGKRVCNFDTRHGYEILKMLEEEIGIVERILYVSRNQHRGCVYFKSMSNVVRYSRKVSIYAKDILDNINNYEYIKLADGLLQCCCLIYKVENQGKKCCKNNYNQIGMGFFVSLCSMFLASTSRLMELCLLLLRELVPLHQQILILGDQSLQPYVLPPSITHLLQVDSIQPSTSNEMDIEPINEADFAVCSVCNKHSTPCAPKQQ